MVWTTEDILRATGGKQLCGGSDNQFSRISIDSRTIAPEDLFVAIEKLDVRGNPVSTGSMPFTYGGPDGRLRASHRRLDKELSEPWWPFHTHQVEKLLSPGQIVPLDIPIRPMGMLWHSGEKLRVTIAGHDPSSSPFAVMAKPVTRNRGEHIIHTGGKYDSYLLVPKIPL